MTDHQTAQDVNTIFRAIRTAPEGFEIFLQVIKEATDQAFAAGRDAVIDYLQNEDFHIADSDYEAMGALRP